MAGRSPFHGKRLYFDRGDKLSELQMSMMVVLSISQHRMDRK